MDISLENYYYGSQIKRYIVQYMAIFSGLKVKIGKNDLNSQSAFIHVPISYGSKDRVVAAILAEQTQNKPIRVPTLSANLTSIEYDPELMVGTGTSMSSVSLPLGSTLPNGLKVTKRYRPIPYRMGMETVVYASNTDQHFQMLEQILMLFDPILQIQIDDAYNDWSKITTVTRENIRLDETYPSGLDRRIITTTLSFTMPIQLSPPFDLKGHYVEQIRLRLQTLSGGESLKDALNDPSVPYETLIDANDLDIPSS